MAIALKFEALPLLGLFSGALGRKVTLECREDNTQCISAVKTGYSAALRHLPRTERISMGVVSETFATNACRIVCQESSLHKGMYLRSGWRSLRSKLQSNDCVSGGHQSPATEAILAHSQLRKVAAGFQATM